MRGFMRVRVVQKVTMRELVEEVHELHQVLVAVKLEDQAQ